MFVFQTRLSYTSQDTKVRLKKIIFHPGSVRKEVLFKSGNSGASLWAVLLQIPISLNLFIEYLFICLFVTDLCALYAKLKHW